MLWRKSMLALAREIHVYDDLVALAVVLAMIVIGRSMRGVWGGALVFVGFLVFVISGIDSAIKLLDNGWSFYERLYHLLWVLLGVAAAMVIRSGFREARERMRAREH
jgi:hypothetical protein